MSAAELVEKGLGDCVAGRETIPALAVSMAVSRLREIGLIVEQPIPNARMVRLYRMLGDLLSDRVRERALVEADKPGRVDLQARLWVAPAVGGQAGEQKQVRVALGKLDLVLGHVIEAEVRLDFAPLRVAGVPPSVGSTRRFRVLRVRVFRGCEAASAACAQPRSISSTRY